MSDPRHFPWHGGIGIALVAVVWPLNWGVPLKGLRTHLLFFPLWLGYALAIDTHFGKEHYELVFTLLTEDLARRPVVVSRYR